MHTRNGLGSRGNSPAKRQLLPEQTAASLELALKWRDEWRASKSAACSQAAEIKVDAAPQHGGDQSKRRAQFAQAIARLEFGRSYWDERLQRGGKSLKTSSSKRIGKGGG
jgi:hypothetical protein